MNDTTLAAVGPLLLGWYVAVGLLFALTVFVLAVREGMSDGDPAGEILTVAVLMAMAAVWAWPLVVKVLYDNNGNWRG